MIEELLKDPSKIGASILMLAAIAAFFYEWVVPGTAYTRVIQENEKLKARNEELTLKVYQALDITERTQRLRGGGLLGSRETRDGAG